MHARLARFGLRVLVAIVMQCLANAAALLPSSRVIQWEPGIPGGITVRTQVFCNVKQLIPGTNIVARGDGVADDTAALQAALNLCPLDQVVWLPAGVYRTSSDLVITRSITVRGAGPTNTTVRMTHAGKGLWFNGDRGVSYYGTADLGTGFTKGATTVTLRAARSDLRPGMLVLIDQLNDGNLVTNRGTFGGCSWCGRGSGARALGQMIEIASVAGTNVAFKPPLYWSYSASLAPQLWYGVKPGTATNAVMYAGAEDLAIDQTHPGAMYCVDFQSAAYCWVRNCNFRLGGRAQVHSYYSLRLEVRDSYFKEVWTQTSGGNYGVLLENQTSAVLVENNIFNGVRGPLVLGAGAAGNVFGYNYVTNVVNASTNILMQDIAIHSAHCMMNLFEGNIAHKAYGDFGWGSSSHQTFFRNWFSGKQPWNFSDLRCVVVDRDNRYYNVVGNVLAFPGVRTSDTRVSSFVYQRIAPEYAPYQGELCAFRIGYEAAGPSTNTFNPNVSLLRHGNFDYVSGSVVWDGSIAETNLPASLYHSSRPSWWHSTPWPPIGPDVANFHNPVPATLRFRAMQSGAVRPSSPQGFRIVSQ